MKYTMSNNWRYSIVDPEDSKRQQRNTIDEFSCCGFTRCCNRYPFQVVNWIAVIVHLATCIAMITIYAGLDEPIEYPYTETYITWKRFDDTPKNLSTFTYLQPYSSKNHCEQQLTKEECLSLTTVFGEPVTQRQEGEADDEPETRTILDGRRRLLMVTQDENLPHGCLNYIASSPKRRLLDTNIQVYYNNASTSTQSCPSNVCICKSNPLPTFLGDGSSFYDHYALTKTGPLDVNLTLQECKSVAKRYDFSFQYYDDGKLSFPKNTKKGTGCIIDTDDDEMYYVDIGEDTMCNDLENRPNNHCVIRKDQTPPFPTCPEETARINTTNDGAFCIGAETSEIEGQGINLGILIISFHALSFLFQAVAGLSEYFPLSLNFIGLPSLRFKYTEEIAKGRNLLRFIEYAFSASIMLIGIGLLNGVTDRNLIAGIAVLTSATQLCGLVAEFLLSEDSEHHNSLYEAAVVLHLCGWLQFFCAYGIIFHAFFRSATAVDDTRPPEFVYVIVWIIFVLYGIFGAVQLSEFLCLKCNPCTYFDNTPQVRISDKKRINYQCKEMTYVILSLTSKLFLGWMIFSNVMFRSDNDS